MEMALSIIQVIICVSLVIFVMVQESPRGASGALTGSSDTDSHYDKIKGRTSGAILKKLTVVFAVAFVIITFAINIL